jgi:hypothetical protein
MSDIVASRLRAEALRLRKKADNRDAEASKLRREASDLDNEAAAIERRENEKIPVDRSEQTLSDGSPVTDDHRELQPGGQQKGYVVLSAAERAKGYVRPVRRSYVHLPCGTTTTMGPAIAETYARDPKFYSGTFCCQCSSHFPLDQFVWAGSEEQVGS